MAYFAKLNSDNIVESVIVAEDIEWVEANHEGTWVETDPEGNFAGIGWTWNAEDQVFIAPMPECGHTELTLNPDTFVWECTNGIHDVELS
jgi:hypothetical protein